jgi:hypothetical protein
VTVAKAKRARKSAMATFLLKVGFILYFLRKSCWFSPVVPASGQIRISSTGTG